MLFKNEVNSMEELNTIALMETEFDKFKVSVICLLFDENGNLVLHRRGPGARDEVGKLLALGGSINSNDINFREALKRELIEEAGNEATYTINDFIGGLADSKIDNTNGELTNWIILAYSGSYTGKLINQEPDRCVGFEAHPLNELVSSPDVGESAKIFIKELI